MASRLILFRREIVKPHSTVWVILTVDEREVPSVNTNDPGRLEYYRGLSTFLLRKDFLKAGYTKEP